MNILHAAKDWRGEWCICGLRWPCPERIPDLEFELPDCTVCQDGRGDMNTDGGSIWCEKCATQWDRDGTKGRPGE